MISLTIHWFLCGLICACIMLFYDLFINKEKINEDLVKGFLAICLFGFVSILITIYFITDDVKNKVEERRNRFW